MGLQIIWPRTNKRSKHSKQQLFLRGNVGLKFTLSNASSTVRGLEYQVPSHFPLVRSHRSASLPPRPPVCRLQLTQSWTWTRPYGLRGFEEHTPSHQHHQHTNRMCTHTPQNMTISSQKKCVLPLRLRLHARLVSAARTHEMRARGNREWPHDAGCWCRGERKAATNATVQRVERHILILITQHSAGPLKIPPVTPTQTQTRSQTRKVALSAHSIHTTGRVSVRVPHTRPSGGRQGFNAA